MEPDALKASKPTIKLRPIGVPRPASAASAPETVVPTNAPSVVDDDQPTIKLKKMEAPVASVEETISVKEESQSTVDARPTIKLKSMTPATATRPTIKLRPIGVPKPQPPAIKSITPAVESTPPSDSKIAKSTTVRIPLEDGFGIDSNAPTMKVKSISALTQHIEADAVSNAAATTNQAAKSKTARIALDSVLSGINGESPLSGSIPAKTIKLKRMTPTADSSTGSSAATIKIKRPGASSGIALKKAPIASVSTEAELSLIDDLDMTNLAELSNVSVPQATENKAFTVIAIIAASITLLVTGALIFCTGAQTGSPDGNPTGNTLSSISFLQPLPWIQ